MSTSERHEDSDGSDIFWPGYVDATTNLILNLLFLLTILMVAVFMFALELGRSSKVESVKPPVTEVTQDEKIPSVAAAVPIKEVPPSEEIVELKREIQRLNTLLAQHAPENEQFGGIVKTAEATSVMPKPQHGLEKVLASELEVLVRFADDAVDFKEIEREQLLESLEPIAASENADIYVEVPAGFSEAKRMGFYRAMAVRNLLIEMKQPKENINVLVVEGETNANASLVRVRAR